MSNLPDRALRAFFRPLHSIRDGDQLLLRAPGATHEYTAESTRIVRPSEVEVLANTGKPELTLVTRYLMRAKQFE
jgi:LPXTG-site transpeptidase (sortase) family protein